MNDDPWPYRDPFPGIITREAYYELYPDETPEDQLPDRPGLTDPVIKGIFVRAIWSNQLYQKVTGGRLDPPGVHAAFGGRYTDFSDEEEYARAKAWVIAVARETMRGKPKRR